MKLVTQAIKGYRLFQFGWSLGHTVFGMTGHEWKTPQLTAHEEPALGNTSGIYIADAPTSLITEDTTGDLLGQCIGWGKAVRHRFGWRVQHCRVTRLWVPTHWKEYLPDEWKQLAEEDSRTYGSYLIQPPAPNFGEMVVDMGKITGVSALHIPSLAGVTVNLKGGRSLWAEELCAHATVEFQQPKVAAQIVVLDNARIKGQHLHLDNVRIYDSHIVGDTITLYKGTIRNTHIHGDAVIKYCHLTNVTGCGSIKLYDCDGNVEDITSLGVRTLCDSP